MARPCVWRAKHARTHFPLPGARAGADAAVQWLTARLLLADARAAEHVGRIAELAEMLQLEAQHERLAVDDIGVE